MTRRQPHNVVKRRHGILLFVALTTSLCLSACSSPKEFVAVPGRAQCAGSKGYSATGPRTFLVRSDWLKEIRGRLKEPEYKARYVALLQQAERSLALDPMSVVHKTTVPPSGDKHDYISWPTYAWPDPEKPGQFKMVDGKYNPVRLSNKFDSANLNRFVDAVNVLSLAYHYSGDRRFAEHAGLLIRTWFVDPDTRMNPNAKYSQFYPGEGETNGLGVLQTWRMVSIIDGIGLIQPSGVLSQADVSTLQNWFREYRKWLVSSNQGLKESKRQNNHGVYYRIQLLSYALFSGDEAAAREVALKASGPLADQVSRDGELVNEVDRADKTHYILYGSRAWMTLASLAECAGVDLWRYDNLRTGGLAKAYQYLVDYTKGGTSFPQTGYTPEKAEAYALLVMGGWAFGRPSSPTLERLYLTSDDPYLETMKMPPARARR